MNFNNTVKKMRIENNPASYVAEKPKKIKKSKVRKDWSNGERYTVGGDTHVAIYQMKKDRDYFATHREGDMYRFEGWDDNRDVFDFSAYNLVWEGGLDANGNIDKVYMILQEYRPIECSRCMTSLSVSDIVLMNGSYYYVDDIGFVDITGDVNRTMKSKIRKDIDYVSVADALDDLGDYLAECFDELYEMKKTLRDKVDEASRKCTEGSIDFSDITQRSLEFLLDSDMFKVTDNMAQIYGFLEKKSLEYRNGVHKSKKSKKNIKKDRDTITVTMIRNGEKENIVLPKEGDDLWSDVWDYDKKNGTDFMSWEVKAIDGYDV